MAPVMLPSSRHMMSGFRTCLAMAAMCGTVGAASLQEQEAARGVIERFAGAAYAASVEVGSMPEHEGCPTYAYEVSRNTLTVRGSHGVALCKGFYDFVTSQKAGICSWSGNRFALPAELPDVERVQRISPVKYHQYFNVVSFGYSTVYWDWKRWEQEIDWMALHGIDMPLALVAQEAISERVFQRLGLADEEIKAWFTGPAHLPWMRMGNISGLDGPLPEEWHRGQIELQHKILGRMRALGMTPICPGFSGFVPKGIKRVYPEAKVVETSWGGHFHGDMIVPTDPLFSRISIMFIEEWEKEFGKCSHYLMDSFNEMEIPFPPHGSPERYDLLAQYGEVVYKAMEKASPGATWVMQGWMLGYQRDIWDERTLAALLSRVPDEQMLLLDMAVDYNCHFWHNSPNYEMHGGFYGKPWVYGVLPNMGGKTGLTGMLSFYANGHLAALRSSFRGRLLGMGIAPEGIENNEVIYELVTDAGWRDSNIRLSEWLPRYNICRYGKDSPALARFWHYMLQSVYGSFTDHPRYAWQRRPGGGTRGTVRADENFHAAVEAFVSCSEELHDNPLYRSDLIELVVASIGGRLEELMQAAEMATREGERDEASRIDQDIEELMLGMDSLLQSHPTHRMERWIDYARGHGTTQALKDYYEGNARRLVTMWGPPVDDYAAKVWSGLIRDYYLPRWQQYRRCGADSLPEWEKHWVEKTRGLSEGKPYDAPVKAALELLEHSLAATSRLSRLASSQSFAYWTARNLGPTWQDWEVNVSSADLRRAQGLRFVTHEGGSELDIAGIRIIMDGKEVAHLNTTASNASHEYHFSIPPGTPGNNECRLLIRVRNPGGSHGQVEWMEAAGK